MKFKALLVKYYNAWLAALLQLSKKRGLINMLKIFELERSRHRPLVNYLPDSGLSDRLLLIKRKDPLYLPDADLLALISNP